MKKKHYWFSLGHAQSTTGIPLARTTFMSGTRHFCTLFKLVGQLEEKSIKKKPRALLAHQNEQFLHLY